MPALWPIVLVAAHTALGEVPKFDIRPTCRASSEDSQVHRPQGACERDENQAYNTLKKQWTGFAAASRERCTMLTRTGGSPSYVELLTCLQTAQDAAKLPERGMVAPAK